MGRPATDKQRYIDQIELMISEGQRLEDVTATKLQGVIGGKYSRIAEILDEYKDAYRPEDAKELPKPAWFNEWVAQVTNFAEGAWFKVAADIKSHIDEATQSFEQRKAELEIQAAEDREQIKALEDQVEVLAGNVSLHEEMVLKLNKENSELNGSVKSKDAQITQLNSDLRSVNKDLQGAESRLSDANSKVTQFTDKLESSESSLRLANNNAKALSSDLEKANAQIDELKKTQSANEEVIKAAAEHNEKKTEKLSLLDAELATANAQLKERDQALVETRSTIENQAKRLEEAAEMRGELKASQSQIADLNGQVERLQAQISE